MFLFESSGYSPLFSGRADSSPLKGEKELSSWLDNLESRLEELGVAYNRASFARYMGNPGVELSQLDSAISEIFGQNATHSNILTWKERVTDPILKQRLFCLERGLLEAEVSRNPGISQMRHTINAQLLNFKPLVSNHLFTRSQLMDILRLHPDREFRRTVYEQALSPLGRELAPQVKALMQRCNELARWAGYANYAELVLANLGLDRDSLLKLFDKLVTITETVYAEFFSTGRARFGFSKLEAWDVLWLAEQQAHLPEHFFTRQSLEPAIQNFLRYFGLELTTLPVRLFNREIPFGALCFAVQIPGDVRIIASPRSGFPFYRTMFHEYGHALHAVFNRQTSYILKREPASFNEGMGELLAFFVQSEGWLKMHTGLPDAEIQQYRQAYLARRIVRWRSLMAQAHFELEAYRNPDQDLDRLNAEMESYYLGVPPVLSPSWAASSFPTTHPLYRQNYIIGEMIAAQTHMALKTRFGDVFAGKPESGIAWFEAIKEGYFAPGATVDWPEKIQNLTGSSLAVEALAQESGLLF